MDIPNTPSDTKLRVPDYGFFRSMASMNVAAPGSMMGVGKLQLY